MTLAELRGLLRGEAFPDPDCAQLRCLRRSCARPRSQLVVEGAREVTDEERRQAFELQPTRLSKRACHSNT